MQIQVIRDIKELEKYREPWQGILTLKNNNITFIELDWILSWWNSFGKSYELFILVLKKEEQILGFCPLMMVPKGLYKEITFIGNPQSPYIDFIMEDKYKEEAIPLIMDFLFQHKGKNLFNIYHVFEKSKSYEIIHEYLIKSHNPFFIHRLEIYYMEIHEEFENYFNKQFSGRTRRAMRKKKKRVSNLGHLAYRRLAFEDMDSVYQIHNKRWQRKVGNREFSLGVTAEFFSKLVKEENLSFKTRIDGITVEDKIIAFIYGFECGGRHTFYRIAHDDDYHIFSPGEMILKEKIEECFERKLTTFDLGPGYEPYKANWLEDYENINTLIFPNHSLIARWIYIKQKMVRNLKDYLRSNPTTLNFRKQTLGKVKYKLTREYLLQRYKKWKGILTRKGPFTFLKSIISPIVKYEKYFVLSKKFSQNQREILRESSYRLSHLALGDIDTIVKITGEEPSEIIRKLSMKHKFYTLEWEGKIVFYYWLGLKQIYLQSIEQHRNISNKECMIYNADFLTTKDTQEIFDCILDQLKGKYKKIYITCTKDQGGILKKAKAKGFQVEERITVKKVLGKLRIDSED